MLLYNIITALGTMYTHLLHAPDISTSVSAKPRNIICIKFLIILNQISQLLFTTQTFQGFLG